MMPNFLGIGAQRSGTTWAYRALAAHPDVFVSEPKELRYYTANHHKGRRWYEAHFQAAANAKARGEITPGYIYRPLALERIAKDAPDIRLFAILRNPVDRAYSAYRFFYNQEYSGLGFKEAFERNEELREQGRYAESLKRLWCLFPRENCLVLLYDDLRRSPEHVAQMLYEFLGVDTHFRPPSVDERINATVLPRTQALLTRIGLARIIELAKSSPHSSRIRAWGAKRTAPPAIREDDREALLRFYKTDIAEVGSLLGRDLSDWAQ